jgi:UDP-N-acetylmuramoyl-tripeptide--D-alanyl-D-alanine ligase
MTAVLKTIVVTLLRLEARIALARHRPFVVAVTGSVGKTTTKEFLGEMLRRCEGTELVRVSEKSMNSEIGLPLAILGLENAWHSPWGWSRNLALGLARAVAFDFPKFLVLEVGADKPRDISSVAKWIRSDVVVVTRLPEVSVHAENYPSLAAVQDEEWSMVGSFRDGGLAVLNGDDANIMARRTRLPASVRVITYGFGALAAIRASDPIVDYTEQDGHIFPSGMRMEVQAQGSTATFALEGVLGTQALTAALAAIATGLSLGYTLSAVVEALESAELPRGRMRILPGVGKTMLIDDTYNASPVAVEAALDALASLHVEGRKIAVLGDMLELGEHSEREHRRVGRRAKEILDVLVTVGKRARWIADEAKKAGMDPDAIMEFPDSDSAGEWMRGHLAEGDIILLKGSQGSGENKIRMERATKRLLRVPEIAPFVLVRQEPEWEKR